MFIPVQKAAIAAITGDQSCVAETRAAYCRCRDLVCDGLTEIGWTVERCSSTMFVWPKIPAKYTSSVEFAMELIEKTGVIVTPGSAFVWLWSVPKKKFAQRLRLSRKAVCSIK